MKLFTLFSAIALIFLPLFALAGDVVPFVPPQWVQDVMNFLQGLPKIGPILTTGILWLSVVATSLTALATAFMAICKGLSKVLDAAKFTALSDKVDALYAKVAPYLMWLSMYNAKLPAKDAAPEEKK